MDDNNNIDNSEQINKKSFLEKWKTYTLTKKIIIITSISAILGASSFGIYKLVTQIQNNSISSLDRFKNDSWDNIIKYSNEGIDSLRKAYKCTSLIGFTHSLNLKDCIDDFQVRVIGENHDINSKNKNPVSLTFQIINTNNLFKVNFSDINNLYTTSKVRNYLNNGFYDLFTDNIKNAIKEVEKSCATKEDDKWKNDFFNEKIFLLSYKEINGENPIDKIHYVDEGNRYVYFNVKSLGINEQRIINNSSYLLRSPCTYDDNSIWSVNNKGEIVNSDISTSLNIYPCFCL